MATTTGTVSQAVGVYYDKLFMERAEANMVHDQFAQRRPLPRNEGNVARFTRYSALATQTTPINEITLPAECDVTAVNVTAQVQPYGCYVRASEVFELTSIDERLQEHVELFASQAGRSMDEIIRAALYSGATTQRVNDRANDAAILTTDTLNSDEVRQAIRTLKGNFAMPVTEDGMYGALVSHITAYNLLNDAAWQAANQYVTPELMKKGELGRLFGCRFVETNNPRINAGGGAGGGNVYSNFFLGKEAYGVVELDGGEKMVFVKHPGAGDTSNPINQYSTVGWRVIFAAVALNSSFMVDVRAGSDV